MSYRIASRYAKSLIELAQEKGKLEEVYKDILLLNKLFLAKVNEITGKFIVLLTNKGREGYLSEIAESFATQYNVIKNITPVRITSAVKLDKATIDNLLDGLRKKEKIEEVQLTEAIDESLLGGFILLYGDKQIDSSVRSALQKLHHLVEDDSYVKKLR